MCVCFASIHTLWLLHTWFGISGFPVALLALRIKDTLLTDRWRGELLARMEALTTVTGECD